MKNSGFNLMNYSTLAAAFISVSEGVPDPNIIYEDINDVSLKMGESYGLDFNDDGVEDVFFTAIHFFNTIAWSTFFSADLVIGIPRNENMIPGSIVTGLDSIYFPSTFYWNSYIAAKNFNLSQSIHSGLPWKDVINSLSTSDGERYHGQAIFGFHNYEDNSSYTFTDHTTRGHFIGDDEGFAAFKFKIDGNYHFGWVRLEVNNTVTKITIKDFAYNALPNTSLLAGNTGLDCGGPSIEKSTVLSPTSARANFTSVLGATTYQIKYRKLGTGTWSNKTVNAPKSSVVLNTLDCNTTYEWKVRADCDLAYSAYSTLTTFTTGACREGEIIQINQVDIFPNPSSDLITIDLSAFSEKNIVATIFDIQGKMILQQNFKNETVKLSTFTIPNGIYILKLQSATEVYNCKIILN